MSLKNSINTNRLRPSILSDLIGQVKTVKRLNILLKNSRKTHTPLPMTIFAGPAGTGKSTLSFILANEMGGQCQIANGGNLRTVKDIIPHITKITKNSILFIDEVHRIKIAVQEFLYPVMEDFRADLSKASYNVEPFTMIGATTDVGMLSKPFRDRFTHQEHLTLYSVNELYKIGLKNVHKLQFRCTNKGLLYLAKISRGVPRILNSYLTWCQAYVNSQNLGKLTEQTTIEAMTVYGVDHIGLTIIDKQYLSVLHKQFSDGPVGIKTLASAANLSVETVENSIEPYLMSLGYISKTAKGRIFQHGHSIKFA